MNLEEKTVSQSIVFAGKLLTVRRDEALLPDGKPCVRELVTHSGGVGVLAFLGEDVLLVRQFRYPYGEVVAEVPAGKLTPGEDPLECGKRELKEETGYTAQKWTPLGVMYPSPGYTDEKIHLYLAEGLTPGADNPDEDEFLTSERVPFARLKEMLLQNELKDAKTAFAVLQYLLRK